MLQLCDQKTGDLNPVDYFTIFGGKLQERVYSRQLKGQLTPNFNSIRVHYFIDC